MSRKNLGTLTVDLVARLGGFTQGMSQAERQTTQAARKIAREKREMAKRIQHVYDRVGFWAKRMAQTVATAAAAAAASFTALAVSGLRMMDDMDELSKRTGIATETISTMSFVARQSSLTLQDVADMYRRINKVMIEARDPANKLSETFKKMGVDVYDASVTAHDALLKIADEISSGKMTFAEGQDLATQIFGDRRAQKFLEVLMLGGEGIEKMQEKARDLGLEVSGVAAGAVSDMYDQVGALKDQLMITAANAVLPLIPAFQELATEISGAVSEANKAGTISKALTGTMGALYATVATAVIVWKSFLVVMGAITAATAPLVTAVSAIIRVGSRAIRILSSYAKIMADIGRGRFISATKHGMEARKLILGIGEDFKGALADGAVMIKEGVALVNESIEDMKNAGETAGKIIPVIGANPYQGSVDRSTGAEGQHRSGGAAAGEATARGSRAATKALTDEERAAQRLLETYGSMVQDMEKRLALVGQEGALAELIYDTTRGKLAGLDEAQKQHLITLQRAIDAREKEVEAVKAADEAQKRHTEQMENAQKEYGEWIRNMEHAVELLGKTREEQERLNQAMDFNPLWTPEQRKELEERLAAYHRARAETEKIVEAMDAVRDAGKTFLTDIISGTKSFKDAFMDALDSILDKILDMVAQNLIEQMLGPMGSTGGGTAGGGWMAGIFGSLFGGGRANGGPVDAGKVYRFGERGPEILTANGKNYMLPGERGTVTPNNQLKGGGTQQTNNFIVQGRVDRRTQEQIAIQVYRKTQAANASLV